MATDARLQRAVVIGSGLIGASIGLALAAAGVEVELFDRDPAVAELAAELGAGTAVGAWPGDFVRVDGARRRDVAIVAVPPSRVAEVLNAAVRSEIAETYMHVASVQTAPLAELKSFGCPLTNVVGTHPMAGSERGGPASGSGSLFRDRAWVICPGRATQAALDTVHGVITACGARAVTMTAERHDAAGAAISALPQLVASALAATLTSLDDDAVAIAGTGIRDTTRLADSDPTLWSEIVGNNSREVGLALNRFLGLLSPLASNGDQLSIDGVRELMANGRAGRERLGGKHGDRPRHWATVEVVIGDRPGAMLDVLNVCRDVAVNVEDLWLEHAQGQPTGVLHLQVDPADTATLLDALELQRLVVVGVQAPHG